MKTNLAFRPEPVPYANTPVRDRHNASVKTVPGQLQMRWEKHAGKLRCTWVKSTEVL